MLQLLQTRADFREGEAFTEPGKAETWVSIDSVPGGVSLRFLNGVLDRVVIHAQDEAWWEAYANPTDLIAGLDLSTATREDVLGVLGVPWKSAPKYVKHRIGTQYLHISFLNEKISRIVVMAKPR